VAFSFNQFVNDPHLRGAIIQDVVMVTQCLKCDGTPCSGKTAWSMTRYFELWKVSGGKVIPSTNYSEGLNPEGTPWNDIFLHCNMLNTCGSFQIDAEIAFIKNYNPDGRPYWKTPRAPKTKFRIGDNLCDPKWRNSGLGPWGTLMHSLENAPPIIQFAEAPKQFHSLAISWDCCHRRQVNDCQKPTRKSCPSPSGPTCFP
jgi:hypothetical protein